MAFRAQDTAGQGGPEFGSETSGSGPDPIVILPGARPSGTAAVVSGRIRPPATRAPVSDLALRQAEPALAGQGRGVPRRLVRVPLGSVVPGKSTSSSMQVVPRPPAMRLAASAPPPRATEDAATPKPPLSTVSRAAYVLREAITIALFVATLAATYYLGRTHAFQNVIVVPEPWTRSSKLS